MKKRITALLAALAALSLLACCGRVELAAPGFFTAGGTEETRAEDAGDRQAADEVGALQESFFRPVAAWQPGTAGASLKLAQTACTVFTFAHDRGVLNLVPSLAREQIQLAWDGLEQEERDAFDEYFPSVCSLLFDCLDDWEAARPLFDDAGLAETMDPLVDELSARADWMALVSYTVTIERIGAE